MSIIKLAQMPMPQKNEESFNPKALTGKNIAAAATGTTLGFAANELVEKLPGYNKDAWLHRYGRRMATAGGALIGAAGVYKALSHKHKKDDGSRFYMY